MHRSAAQVLEAHIVSWEYATLLQIGGSDWEECGLETTQFSYGGGYKKEKVCMVLETEGVH